MTPEDLKQIEFRRRRRARPVAASSTSTVWWVVAIIGAVVFLLLIRALLDRTAWTAGPTPAAQADVPTAVTQAPGVEPPPMAMQGGVPMVYRCVDRAGGVSLQSQPCGPGQRTTRAIPAPPDREPPRRVQAYEPRSRVSSWGGVWLPDQGDAQRQAARARCASARAQRESTLQAVGLKRTYDLLQRLDAMVARACQGA